jgi:phosphoesterase RecJ-like protein
MKEVMQQILAKIKEYDTILIFRHKRMDGDCTGATKGLQRILRLSFPEKTVLLYDGQSSDYLAFLGADDGEIADEVYRDALGIVLDTATSERISNPKYALCKELVKIDHHIPVEDYGVLNWVEEHRSSACELVAYFYATFRDELKLDKEAATYLYTGMVTDSGRFQFRSVSGDTMRLAGMLLDAGVDTDVLYAHLYLREFEELKFKSQVYQDMKITENGVAYIYVSRDMKDRFGLTNELASSVVSYMENIKGCLCWLAFIENDDGSEIRVRLRSRFVPINTIAERYRGGGHACASGATVYDRQEVYALIREADTHIKKYKETHEGWL